MRTWNRVGIGVILCLASFGCSSALKALNDPTINKALSEIPFPKDVAGRIALYQKYAHKFQRFHDSGELEEADVKDVLRDAGVIKNGTSKPGAPGIKPSIHAPKVSKVPAPVQNYGGEYRWPTDAGIVSSEYGARWGKKHEGVDVAAHEGEPIKAAAAGTIIYAGDGLRGYGNVLIVRHDDKTTTLYAHNKALLMKKDERVEGGHTIALLGNTGRSTGPHVHFEIRVGDVAVNPRSKLGKAPYALQFAPDEAMDPLLAVLNQPNE